MNISISEINSYLRCRRAWDLTSGNRQSLKHKVTPKIYFMIGSAVHEAIDAQARGDDPQEFLKEYISRERADRRMAYEEAVGSSPWQSEMEEFEDSATLASKLVDQYFLHYGAENPLEELGLKYVATEVPFSIPLANGINFVGTFDGIATDIATESKFYLTENKTAGRKPNLEIVERSNQFLGYNWAFLALTGFKPAGTLYNLIMKRLIKEPKTLKSGALSVDKNASVTTQTVLKAIQTGGHDPLKYLDYLEFLQEREAQGDDRFFLRHMFTYTDRQLENWYHQVLEPMSQEMLDPLGVNNHLDIYPNYLNCEGCLVADICKAMDHDWDVDQVVSQRYQVGKTPTGEAVDGAAPVVVQSSDELISYLREKANG